VFPVDRRVERAFLLQPFVCAVSGFALFPILASTHGGRTHDLLQAAIACGVVTGVVAALIAGIAAFTFGRLRKLGPITAARTLLYGAAFGNIPAALVIVGTLIVRRDIAALADAVAGSQRAIVFGTAIGVMSSAVFWLMAGRYVTSSRADTA
jgi:hypothetical protein